VVIDSIMDWVFKQLVCRSFRWRKLICLSHPR
jgi:hypothetical protein